MNPDIMLMRLKRVLIGAGCGIAAFSLGIWCLGRALESRETKYRGESFYYWLDQLNGQNSDATAQARALFTNEIIPHLTRTLLSDTNDFSLKLALVKQLNLLPGVRVYCMDADDRRAYATSQLGELGPAAAGAVPALLRALQSKDDAVHGSAATALGKIHSDPDTVIPALIACLSDPEGNCRAEAATALACFGARSKAAVPMLTRILEGPFDKDLFTAVRPALKAVDADAATKAGVK